MAFDTLDPHLKAIATKALAFFKSKYGRRGLTTGAGIAQEIEWAPSFHLKANGFSVVAVEVADNLYPEALRGAAYTVEHYDGPLISAYQVCSLNAYQKDPKQTKINLLRKHGFGIVTVDEDGTVTMQHPATPLAQHVSEEELDSRLQKLTPTLRVSFRSAHATYRTNIVQGLQQAGQIVEAIIGSIATQAHAKGVISKAELKGRLADVIDSLYGKTVFKDHRAALGGAREFTKDRRNIASHAPKNAKDAADTARKCKAGFLDGVNVASNLIKVCQAMGYKIRIHSAC